MSALSPVCPDCRGALQATGLVLDCTSCGAHFEPSDGFPKLFHEDSVGRMDRFMRLFYNGLPQLHDPLTTHLLPRLQRDGSEAGFRNGTLETLSLQSLPSGARILEVGVGAGANLPYIAQHLRPEQQVEYWGLDLARGMLKQCRKRSVDPRLDLHLLLGDAHHLPFPDASFDRVFHIGAVATYSDPSRALAEMARVARPDTPIAVVDEHLDPQRDNRLRDRLAFRLLTFYDRDPHPPVEHLPASAVDVQTVQLSRFLYCLSFRTPPSAPPP